MPDVSYVRRWYSADLTIRAASVVTTAVAQEICDVQSAGPLASMALARTVTGAVLMASQMSEGQSIGIHFNGDGPLGNVFAEASFEGEARAYCAHTAVDIPFKEGHLDVAAGIGRGLLTVVRSVPFEKQPQIGTVDITSGGIGEDLAYYLQQSFQIPSIIALGAYLHDDGHIAASGGVLIELMPGAPESVIEKLERNMQNTGSISKRLSEGINAEQLLQPYLGDMVMVNIEHDFPVRFACKCTRQRVERSLMLLGEKQLSEMASDKKGLAVRCEFCGRNYELTMAEVSALYRSTLQ